MDKVSVTETQANSNKILKTWESNKNSMFQAKLCFSGKVLFGQVKVNKGQRNVSSAFVLPARPISTNKRQISTKDKS